MMSAERADQIARWHENAIGGQSSEDLDLDYLGIRLVVPPAVHPPTPVSPLLGNAVLSETGDSDRVLDMGTGSGVSAILAAGKAREVVGVDVNPSAIAAAVANASRNGVADRIEFFHSDLFDEVSGDIDLIIFDPPFRWFKPRSMRERATTDENYETMTGFFQQVDPYLRQGGRILLLFGSSGDRVESASWKSWFESGPIRPAS